MYLFFFSLDSKLEGCQVVRMSSEIQGLAHCGFSKTDVPRVGSTDLLLFEPTVNTASFGIGSAANALLYFVITFQLNGDFEQLHFFALLFSYLASAMHSDSHEGTYSWDYQSKSESFLACRLCDSASVQEIRVCFHLRQRRIKKVSLLPTAFVLSPSCANATIVTVADIVLFLLLPFYSRFCLTVIETID